MYSKSGFAHQNSNDNGGYDVSNNDDTIINKDVWNLLKTEVNIYEYMKCNEEVITSAVCNVNKLIQNS